jgi:hypothetical protein
MNKFNFNRRVKERVLGKIVTGNLYKDASTALSRYLAKATLPQVLQLGRQLGMGTAENKNLDKIMSRVINLRAGGDTNPQELSSRLLYRLVRGTADPSREVARSAAPVKRFTRAVLLGQELPKVIDPGNMYRAEQTAGNLLQNLAHPADDFGLGGRALFTFNKEPNVSQLKHIFDPHLSSTGKVVRAGDLPYDPRNIVYKGTEPGKPFGLNLDGTLNNTASNVFVSPNPLVATGYTKPLLRSVADDDVAYKTSYLYSLNANKLSPLAGRNAAGSLPYTSHTTLPEPEIARDVLRDRSNYLSKIWGDDFSKPLDLIKKERPVVSDDYIQGGVAKDWRKLPTYPSPNVYEGQLGAGVPLNAKVSNPSAVPPQFPVFNHAGTPYETVLKSVDKQTPMGIWRPNRVLHKPGAATNVSITPESKSPVVTSAGFVPEYPNGVKVQSPHWQLQEMRFRPPVGGKVMSAAEKSNYVNRMRAQHGGGKVNYTSSFANNGETGTYVPQWNTSKLEWSDVPSGSLREPRKAVRRALELGVPSPLQ